MASEHEAFLDETLRGVLKTGETVTHRGLAIGAWGLLFGWLLPFVRHYYYIVVTNQRLLEIRTGRTFLRFRPKPGNQRLRFVEHNNVEAVVRSASVGAKIMSGIIGVRMMAVQTKSGGPNFNFGIYRKRKEFANQRDIYDNFLTTLLESSQAKLILVRHR